MKIVLVGNTKVGKTTLLSALSMVGDQGRGYSASLDIPIKAITNKTLKVIIATIYDLRSQRYFPYLHSLFYNNSVGAIIVFDVMDKSSFKAIKKWRDIIRGHTGSIPLLLVGNKTDLRDDDSTNEVALEDALLLAKDLSQGKEIAIPYIELSAKSRIIRTVENDNEEDILEIDPLLDEFRRPFFNWLMTLAKKKLKDENQY
jgi:small GTP-binding protein